LIAYGNGHSSATNDITNSNIYLFLPSPSAHLPPLSHWSENEATGFVQNEPHCARERRPRFGQQGLSTLLCGRQI